jgi:hypothetical protein
MAVGTVAPDEVVTNQKTILANQKTIIANQAKLDRILANQDKIMANQEKVFATGPAGRGTARRVPPAGREEKRNSGE